MDLAWNTSAKSAKKMLILPKSRFTVDCIGWTEWRHQSTRGNWKWISPRALRWLAPALTTNNHL